jgi:hypothetical protein
VHHLRLDHGSQRRLLQMQQLWHDLRLRLNTKDTKLAFVWCEVLTRPKAGTTPGL